MRTTFLTAWPVAALLALLSTPGYYPAQPQGGGKPQQPKPPPDEFRSLVKEVEEAYKAPFEVDKDVLDELRKQYKNPTPDREAKIFREIRRLYNLSPEQEQAITRELRRAYDQPSAAQEDRVFQVIRQGGRLAPGTVPIDVQYERAGKLFRGFDRDSDGRLSPDEMPEALRGQVRNWDRNGDGFIDLPEYEAYYQAHLRFVSDKVASGEIQIKLPKGALQPPADAEAVLSPAAPHAPVPGSPQDWQSYPIRYGKLPPGLPAWFVEYDTDCDAQISLAEWRRQGRSLDEFAEMDLDGDFLITPREMLRYLAEQAKLAATEQYPDE